MHPLIPREFKTLQNVERSFKVLQYNILADDDNTHDTTSFFQVQIGLSYSTPEENFCKVSQECLAWSHRYDQIMNQLSTYDADIICLEEVDYFEKMKSELAGKGFDGNFCPKKASPCRQLEHNSPPDGVAMFHKTEVFELKETVSKYLFEENGEEGRNGFLLNVYEHIASKKIVIIGATHLKAKEGFEERRKCQTLTAISTIFEIASKYQGAPIIFCGDFNGESDDPFYKCLVEKGFQSSFVDAIGKEAEFTTWKIRPTGEVKHTIDYIWQCKENALKISGFLDLMRDEDVPAERFPSFGQPSDHIPLCFEFQI